MRATAGYMPNEKGGYYSRLQREEEELSEIRSELLLAERRLSEMRKQLQGEAPCSIVAAMDHRRS